MKQPARTSTRQPLISRAMKVALMAERSGIGNDEPWNRIYPTDRPDAIAWRSQTRQGKMTIFSSTDCLFRRFQTRPRLAMDLCRRRSCRHGRRPAPPTPRAASAGPGAYDGTWNVMFTTRAGNCSSTNSVPFTVVGHAGFRRPAAARSPAASAARGAVAVRISVGASRGERQRPAGRQFGHAAAGAGSSPATSAAAAGRRRGA